MVCKRNMFGPRVKIDFLVIQTNKTLMAISKPVHIVQKISQSSQVPGQTAQKPGQTQRLPLAKTPDLKYPQHLIILA